jgi:hypothetical protein
MVTDGHASLGPITRRSVAVVAWGAVALYVVAMSTVPLLMRDVDGTITGWEDGLAIAFFFYVLVGAVLVTRRPRNAVGWILLVIGALVGISAPLESYASWRMSTTGTPDALATLGAWLNSWYFLADLAGLVVFIPLLYPDGRLLSRVWRIPAGIAFVAFGGTVVAAALAEQMYGQSSDYVIKNPIGITGLVPIEEHPAFGILVWGAGIGLLAAFAALIVRYRRGNRTERLQLKWFLFVVALLPITFFPLPEPLDSIVFTLLVAAVPLAIALAILRYRLYDIDRIISRTVTYGLVTALLFGLYSGLVFVLRSLLPLEGALPVAGSTLAVAAAFNPVRRRIQGWVDHRFNRTRYDAERMVEAFQERLRQELDLDQLEADLRLVASSTVSPDHITLWVRSS